MDVTFQNPCLGGISDSKYLGADNSFYIIEGLDVFSEPGLIYPARKLTNETTITEQCNNILYTTASLMFFFSIQSGKIWKRDISTGAYTLVHTTVPTSGNTYALNAIEYNNFIYWSTGAYLHKMAIANCADSTWSTGLTQNFTALSSSWGGRNAMCVVNDVLYIGTGNTVSQVDNTTFTAGAITLPYNYYVKTLVKNGTDLVIGANYANDSKRSKVLIWDTYSESFSYEDDLQDNEITCSVEYDNTVLFFAGKSGNVYYLNGSKADFYMKLPYAISSTYPNISVDFNSAYVYRNLLYLGITDYIAQRSGVYVFGSISPQNKKIISMQYPLDSFSAGGTKLYSAQIKAVAVVDSLNVLRVYVTWYGYNESGTLGYNVSVLHGSNRIEYATIQTILQHPSNKGLVTLNNGWVDYVSLPSGASVDMKIGKVTDSFSNVTVEEKVQDTDRIRIDYKLGKRPIMDYFVKIDFTSVTSAHPTITRFGINYE